jgi:hypothetical protein
MCCLQLRKFGFCKVESLCGVCHLKIDVVSWQNPPSFPAPANDFPVQGSASQHHTFGFPACMVWLPSAQTFLLMIATPVDFTTLFGEVMGSQVHGDAFDAIL